MKTEQKLMTVYIHVDKNDLENKPVIFNQDVSCFSDYVFIGVDDVLVNIPIIDMTQARIGALEKEEKEVRAKFNVKIKNIQEQIQSLRAIEYNEGN